MTKKSNHKHEYELVKMEEVKWFTHEKKCKICGHVNNKVKVSEWNLVVFEDGNEKRLEEKFPTEQEAELWAESVGFECFKVAPITA